MSRATTLRRPMNCGRSERASRASAVCSAASAARTFPASWSCCDAIVSVCSTSASTHSSRERESSWYSDSSASCWLCDSSCFASRAPIFACASRTASCASRATMRASLDSLPASRNRCATSSRTAASSARVLHQPQASAAMAIAGTTTAGRSHACALPRAVRKTGGGASVIGGYCPKNATEPCAEPLVGRPGLDHPLAAERAGVLRDACVRREEGRALEPRLPELAEHVVEVAQPFARADGHRVDLAAPPALEERPDIRVRAHAAIALHVLHRRAAAAQRVAEQLPAAVAAKDHHAPALHVGELRQREERFAVEASGRRDHVRDAIAGERLLARPADRRGAQALRPPAAGADHVQRLVDGVGADEHREVVRVESVGGGDERARVLEVEDLEDRKHDRLAAFARESSRRGPRSARPAA